jgi:hypothetical protein
MPFGVERNMVDFEQAAFWHKTKHLTFPITCADDSASNANRCEESTPLPTHV